ncbi:MAG: ATP-dependent RecD-like DNA helicase [Vulcanimicrobiota bacterium]
MISESQDKHSTIKGVVDRIVYNSPETGFTVARISNENDDIVTVVGKIASLKPGETGVFEGNWVKHKKFGEQFQVESYRETTPSTLEGIRKYLGSGMVPGIGPHYASKLVKQFGCKTLEIIQNHPEQLKKVPGIGKKRIEKIKNAWNEQKNIRNIMIFLQGYGLGASRAVKIYKRYGDRTLELIKKNPYRLARDIQGIGFIIADKIARNMGVEKNSPARAESALVYILRKASETGHCFVEKEKLIYEVEKFEISSQTIEESLEKLNNEKQVEIEENRVYPVDLYKAEKNSAEMMADLLKTPSRLPRIKTETIKKWIEKNVKFELIPSQIEAIQLALNNKVSIITGGPGVGKTTILTALVGILLNRGDKLELCAPTGRAAKRMSQAVNMEARTIHRVLRFKPEQNCFEHGREKPLKADWIIVDEISMIDISLFAFLLSAIKPDSHLVLVGDKDQLPSVGPGNVLSDLLDTGVIPTYHLTEIFRQKARSLIIRNAHRVNRGQMPRVPAPDLDKLADFYFIETDEKEKIEELIIKSVTERIPQRFGFDPMEDIQVLTPMNKRDLGATSLCNKLQKILNPGDFALKNFKISDRVMQTANNYEKEVFNGDMGRVAGIDKENQVLKVDFDENIVEYEIHELDQLKLAYATTVHKAQGSEFPAVVIPLYTGHFILLQRNLLYTAITRASRLVVLTGSKKALATAVKNNKIKKRNTNLSNKISCQYKIS